MEEDELWEVSEEQKLRFAGIFLLEHIINHPQVFEVWLERDDRDLEPVLEWLLVQEWIEIRNDKDYVPNNKGREILKKFLARYAKFVYFFDVFSAIDLTQGEFAFTQYFDFLDENAFRTFLQEERFEDLRIAVAEYLDIDAVEIVFMNYMKEEKFGKNAHGWQFDLLLGTIWDEIIEICNTAIDVSELGFKSAEGWIAGDVVMADVLTQGANLLGDLLNKADATIKSKGQHSDSEQIVEPVAFPKASEFDFSTYTKPDPDPFWDSDWDDLK